MSTRRPLVYWDTCVFLAWIKGEQRAAGEMAGVEAIAAEVFKNNVLLITSVITKAEIPLVHKLSPGQQDKFNKVFGRTNIQEVEVTARIATTAGELRKHYWKSATAPSLGFADAIHLATAIVHQADRFQTFDGQRSAVVAKKVEAKYLTLLPLSGNVAGYPLTIEAPAAVGAARDQTALDLRPRGA